MKTTTSDSFVIGVGVDTARYGHHVTFLGPDRQHVAEPLPVAESGVRCDTLYEAALSLAQEFRLEITGNREAGARKVKQK